MKNVRSLVVLVFCVLCMCILWYTWNRPQDDPRVLEKRTQFQEQKLLLKIRNLERDDRLLFWSIVGVLSSICLTALIIGFGIHRSMVKKASVHTYKIGKHSEIAIHERDLKLAAPIAMGLINAEQLKQYNAGIERAFQLNLQIAEVQSRYLRTLQSKTPMIQALSEVISDHREPVRVPTFQELLQRGEIQPGKPMILGFENGIARRGSFLDIYSAAVAGESGSGKTGTLLYLIASGIIAERVRFYGIDPHYPHPKSLGYKTKPLWEKGLMSMATNMIVMQEVLEKIETTIDNRLKQIDLDTSPVVLVIDELAFLSRSSLHKPLAHTMERISTEGRKCQVYMLASSQTWLVARTGESSVVRDTLTSAYVHRIKPKQANLLLQSKEASQTVERYIKKPGECLLVPVCADPVVVNMPLITEHDMIQVANMVEPIFVDQVNNQVNNQVNVDQSVDLVNTCEINDVDLLHCVSDKLKKTGDLTRLAETIQVDKGYLSRVLHGQKPLSANTRTKLLHYLGTSKIIPFPG